jgi:transposase-like protein
VFCKLMAGHLARTLFLRHGCSVNLEFENMNLVKLMEEFGSDEKCRRCLEIMRWAGEPKCPRCQSPATKIANREQFDCDSCHYQFSATSGTIFHDSHLPLWKWSLATYILTESRKGVSANQIKRMLGVTYKTAWYLCHRIRASMIEVNRPKLTRVVEMDETYIGGKHLGRGWKYCGRSDKEPVIGIRQRGGDLRFFHAREVTSGVLEQYIRENISDDVEFLMTDESNIYPGPAKRLGLTNKHKRIRHKSGVYVVGDVHTNTVESAFSLLKRGVVGTWHKVSAKHLQAYCEEMAFRFNNRQNPFLFRDTILKLIDAPVLEYKKLTAEAA